MNDGLTIIPYSPFFHHLLAMCYGKHPDIQIEVVIPGDIAAVWRGDEDFTLGRIDVACPSLEVSVAIRRHLNEALLDLREELGEEVWWPPEAPEFEFDCYMPW